MAEVEREDIGRRRRAYIYSCITASGLLRTSYGPRIGISGIYVIVTRGVELGLERSAGQSSATCTPVSAVSSPCVLSTGHPPLAKSASAVAAARSAPARWHVLRKPYRSRNLHRIPTRLRLLYVTATI